MGLEHSISYSAKMLNTQDMLINKMCKKVSLAFTSVKTVISIFAETVCLFVS